MKRLVSLAAALFAGIFMLMGCEETKIRSEKLPEPAKAFITQYFPGTEVVFAERERDNGTRHYNVRLADGTEIPYTEGVNYQTVPDGFVVSDNVEVTKVRNIDTGYEFSDHNPVEMAFVLK